MRTVKTLLLILCLVPSAGCSCNTTTEFPPGLQPLEDNTAPVVASTEDDPYPEVFSFVSGEHLDYDWTHARGFIKRPIEDLWAALQDPEVVIDRRPTDRQSYDIDAISEYEHSFTIHYVTEEIISIEWDEDWRYGIVDGSAEAPNLGFVRYQKVWGSDYIELLEGSILIRRITDEVSEIEFVKHLDAFAAGTSDIEQTLKDLYEDLLAASYGLPIPH